MLSAMSLLWILQAIGGASLFTLWLVRGGHRQRELVYEPGRRGVPAEERRADARERGGESRIPLALIGSHGAMGVFGVAVVIAYASAGSESGWEPAPWFLLAWALGLAALGIKMARGGSEQRARAAKESPVELAEDGFPKAVVALHGLGALAVITLTLLVAIGIGR